jgi:mono/diheme cytochrome c family protein
LGEDCCEYAKCHGKPAEGRHFGGPSLISDKTAATSTADLRNIITNGKGRMPNYASKLTSEEIDTLIQQIKTLSKKE